MIGASKSALSCWISEKYEPCLKDLCGLCDILGVSADYLLGRDFPSVIAERNSNSLKESEESYLKEIRDYVEQLKEVGKALED